jgi:hypothetical protein
MRKADNLTTFIMLIALKFESLNLLEPSGPVQACNVNALPLPVLIPVAARSKAWVCDCSLVGNVGSNPNGGMDVCLL